MEGWSKSIARPQSMGMSHPATRRSRAYSIKIIRGSFNDDFAVHTGLKMSGKEAGIFELAASAELP